MVKIPGAKHGGMAAWSHAQDGTPPGQLNPQCRGPAALPAHCQPPLSPAGHSSALLALLLVCGLMQSTANYATSRQHFCTQNETRTSVFWHNCRVKGVDSNQAARTMNSHSNTGCKGTCSTDEYFRVSMQKVRLTFHTVLYN